MATQIPPGNSSSDLEGSSFSSDSAWRPSSATPAGSQGWTAIDCVRALCRNRLILLCAAGLGILTALFFSAIRPRVYQSHASVQVQSINENFLNLRDIYPTTAPGADNAVYVQTQAEMLRQDALIEEVVRKLHLYERPEFQGASRLWNPSAGQPSNAELTPAIAKAVERVKTHLQVVPSRASSIIQIVYDAHDPQTAADVPNALADTFIEQNIEARQHAAKQTLASLTLELEQLRKRIPDAGTASGSYSLTGPHAAAGREADANRKFYETISQRADEARVASTVRQSNIRLVGPAQPPARPYKPNIPLNLALGLCGSLALAIAYVMLREQTNSALRAPGEAAAYLTLPELGAIPKAENPRFLAALSLRSSSLAALPVERASLEQPFSGLSESFRATLASILSAGRNGDSPRTLVITSSRPMEGKTTVVSNLGIALAEIGSRVLLIDGDLRRPRLHKVFDQINSWGLSDMLREKNAIEELPIEALVKKTTVPHLSLLSSGTCTDNIFGLLCSGRMARLLPRFRQEFDYVLVDAPPCLEFADARIMARYAETLLLVVRADYTARQTAQAAVQRLLLDGIPVMGVIFNYWDSAHSSLYGYARYRQELS